MEAILLRFPHLGYQIFDQLDNTVLTICREVNNSWSSFIDNEKLPWIRMITQHIKPLTLSWKIFLQKFSVNFLIEMATSVIQRFKFYPYPEKRELINTVPMHFAAMTGNTEMIKRLIKIGANLNEIDSLQFTPLHYAARSGHMTAYQLIMENNPTKNPDIGYMTPFHMAAKHGHLSICKLIIDHVEDKNPKNINDCTPLHYAASGGFIEICLLIIIELIAKSPRHESGITPLHHAAMSGNLAIFKLIFNNITDKNPPIDYGTMHKHLAVKSDNLEMFQWLYENIEDIIPRDNKRNSPLHLAARSGYLAICQLIIENVKNVNPTCGLSALSPLHLAARFGHYDICKLFMENSEERIPRTTGQNVGMTRGMTLTNLDPRIFRHIATSEIIRPM